MNYARGNGNAACAAIGLLLLAVAAFSGCGPQRVISLVCDESYVRFLSHEADLFSLVYAKRAVTIYPIAIAPDTPAETLAEKPLLPYVARPLQECGVDLVVRQSLKHIAEEPFVDLYWCDSVLQRRALEEAGIVMRSQRVGCVSPVILIPAEIATENVSSLATLFEHRVRLGVIGPERGGLGEVSAMALERLPKETWEGSVFEFESAKELLVAIESQIVDAVLVWRFQALQYTRNQETAQTRADEVEYLDIPLFTDETIVAPINVLTLSGGFNPSPAVLFVNFLLSPAVRHNLDSLGLGSP